MHILKSMLMRSLLLSLFLFLSNTALAALGFYSGSFDPVTLAHESIIRAAALEPGVEHLFVLVNTSGEKNFFLSGNERIKLLKAGLKDLGSQVSFIRVRQEDKERMIKEIAGGRPIMNFIGEDSFEKLPSELIHRPLTDWIVFKRGIDHARSKLPHVHYRNSPQIAEGVSSTLVRQNINTPQLASWVSTEVIKVMKENHFYEKESTEPEVFLKAAKDFHEKLKKLKPDLDLSSMMTPEMKWGQSYEGWMESLSRTAQTLQTPISCEGLFK